MRAQLDLMLRDHGIELRRFVAQSLSQHTGQIISEVRALIDGGNDQLAPLAPEPEAELQEPGRTSGATLWLSAVAAAIALFAGVLWYHAANDRTQRVDQYLSSRGASTPSGVAAVPRPRKAAPAVVAAEIARSAAARNAAVMVEPVPYGESPLGGARIDAVQNILARLVAAGFRGTVEIRSIPGRFCLQGSRRYRHAAGRGPQFLEMRPDRKSSGHRWRSEPRIGCFCQYAQCPAQSRPRRI